MQTSTTEAAADRRKNHRQADVIVVGAGIFGAAMAVTLARQSRSVFLLERSLKEPDRIVGELMQPGGVRALEKLGLRHCLDDIDAVPVKGYHVCLNGRPVDIPYPPDGSATPPENATKSPEGLAFHHGRFVRNLRAAAAAEPNITIVETEVKGLIKMQETGQVLGVKSLAGSRRDYFFAPLTVIADGYRSKFRGEIRSRQPQSKSRFWALELRDASLPSPHFGHVFIGKFSPVLLYQIGTHETRALINVPEGLEAARAVNGGVPNYIKHCVMPNLTPALQSAFSESLGTGHLRCMPNSFLPAASNSAPGLIVAGDALNMRHPLTGGGMTVALSDVVLLADLLAPPNVPDFEDTRLLLWQLRSFHWQRKSHAFVINILAQALYSLFAADDFYLGCLRQGTFKYLSRGGIYRDGPASLLGAIAQKPVVLLCHFFAVAVYSMWMYLLSRPAWMLPLSVFQCCGILLKACLVIVPYMISELSG